MADKRVAFIDASRLVVESTVRAGADIFIGYPITPANLVYLYSTRAFPSALPAPDEISTLQWMAGFSAAGHIPVTATSFPGFALMLESVNMAFMMELPMVIVLIQRLGPSTGTATQGAQGDLLLLRGAISGGFKIPTLAISNFEDAWELSAKAVHMAVNLRTPVILLSSKEMLMTQKAFDMDALPEISPVEKKYYSGEAPYKPYAATENLVPPFLPVGNDKFQVRLTASTHDEWGILRNVNPESMKNTRRLLEKIEFHKTSYEFYDYQTAKNSETLIISFGITAEAAREARLRLLRKNLNVDMFIPKTLIPIPDKLKAILPEYKKIIIAEENLTGQLAELLFGTHIPEHVTQVNAMGKMISPEEIMEACL